LLRDRQQAVNTLLQVKRGDVLMETSNATEPQSPSRTKPAPALKRYCNE
jgi:hypothetical protein